MLSRATTSINIYRKRHWNPYKFSPRVQNSITNWTHFALAFKILRVKHDYNTRSKNNIRKNASSRNWGHWSSTNFASNDWNKLDLSIRQSPSLASFKRALRIVNSLKSNFFLYIHILFYICPFCSILIFLIFEDSFVNHISVKLISSIKIIIIIIINTCKH